MKSVSNGCIRGSTQSFCRLVSPCLCAIIAAGSIAAMTVRAQAQDNPNSAVSSAPSAPQDLRNLAKSYLASGDYDKAIECFLTILANKPSDAVTLKADLGLCYKFKRNYDKAIPILTEVGAVNSPRQVEALFWIDDSYCEQGNFAKAAEHLTTMLSQHPELRSQVLTRRSSRYEATGQLDKTLADHREYVVLSPNDDLTKRLKLKIAELTYRQKGKIGEFPVLLQEATDIVNAETDAVLAKELSYVLGSLYINTEQWDKATSHYQSLLADYPADALAHNKNLGRSYKGKRDYANALPLLKEVAEKSEGDEKKDASFLVVDCLTEQKMNDEAIVTLNKMLADHPDWKERILFRRALCRCDGPKQYIEAIADLEEYITLCQADADIERAKMTIAEVYIHSLHKTKEARVLISALIAAHPDFPDMILAKSELAYCSYAESNYAEAAILFEDAAKAPELGNFRAACLYMAADSYARTKAGDKCREIVKKLVVTYPDDPWTKLAPSTILAMLANQEVGK